MGGSSGGSINIGNAGDARQRAIDGGALTVHYNRRINNHELDNLNKEADSIVQLVNQLQQRLRDVDYLRGKQNARLSTVEEIEDGVAISPLMAPRQPNPSELRVINTSDADEPEHTTPTASQVTESERETDDGMDLDEVENSATTAPQLTSQVTESEREIDNGVDLDEVENSATIAPPLNVTEGINYESSFEWSNAVHAKSNEVFGISEFRLSQEGVINAVMDGRDVLSVMPTGGGKSLTYQLPALMAAGCTIVFSPLISLMEDQVQQLQKRKVKCMMFRSTTPSGSDHDHFHRMLADDVKLVYVTPEKYEKNGSLGLVMDRLFRAKRLARFVIDEAHCLIQDGDDHRPAYKELFRLRERYRGVPITCTTATCPPTILGRLIEGLKLNPTTDGTHANYTGTVHFSAPLYRPNLNFRVFLKMEDAAKILDAMHEWIRIRHAGESGVIYCLSRKDTEEVASGLRDRSHGRLKVAAYHAKMSDKQREDILRQWMEDSIQIICATIAFGLGIDKRDVRFVVHHSIPKSLEGYYQESGRAGRDGKAADCHLYYRPTEGVIQSSMAWKIGDRAEVRKDKLDRLYAMIKFAQDLVTCRKVAFAKYFIAAPDISALQTCGHCDNCNRRPGSLVTREISVEAWQILTVLKKVKESGGNQTVNQLVRLVKGLKQPSFSVGVKQKCELDLETMIGGRVGMSRDDIARLTMHLLVEKYIQEVHVETGHKTVVYLSPSEQARRLMDLTRGQIEKGKGPAMSCVFLVPPTKKKPHSPRRSTAKRTAAANESSGRRGRKAALLSSSNSLTKKVVTRKSKGRSPSIEISDVEDDALSTDDEEKSDDFNISDSKDEEEYVSVPEEKKKGKKRTRHPLEDDDEVDYPSRGTRSRCRSIKRPRRGQGQSAAESSNSQSSSDEY